jgi:SOS-response transcriptional repressor LexA
MRRNEEARKTICNVIRSFTAFMGRPPTRREIAKITGMNRGVVQYHVQCLHRQGRLEVDFNMARGIRLVQE